MENPSTGAPKMHPARRPSRGALDPVGVSRLVEFLPHAAGTGGTQRTDGFETVGFAAGERLVLGELHHGPDDGAQFALGLGQGGAGAGGGAVFGLELCPAAQVVNGLIERRGGRVLGGHGCKAFGGGVDKLDLLDDLDELDRLEMEKHGGRSNGFVGGGRGGKVRAKRRERRGTQRNAEERRGTRRNTEEKGGMRRRFFAGSFGVCVWAEAEGAITITSTRTKGGTGGARDRGLRHGWG